MSGLVTDESLCHELPFSTICDDLLQSALHSFLQPNYETNFENLKFSLFLIDDRIYNNDIEVNELLMHNRINVPKSRSIFLHNFPLLCIIALTIKLKNTIYTNKIFGL